MPPRQRQIDDWHPRLLVALEARYQLALRQNRNNQNTLRQALEALRRSTKPVHVQKGGNNKGMIRGLPAAINAGVQQLIFRIIKGEEPVVPAGFDPDDINEDGHNGEARLPKRPLSADVRNDTTYKQRKYRDSIYAILAALWEGYNGAMGRELFTKEVQRRAARYCDMEIEYDWRTGRHGVWKAKDGLIANGYVLERRQHLNQKFYYLTERGAQLCFLLFNDKFHPSHGDYPLVEPRARPFTHEEIFGGGGGAVAAPPAVPLPVGGGGQRGVVTPVASRGPPGNVRTIHDYPAAGGGGILGGGGGFGDDYGAFDDDDYDDVPLRGPGGGLGGLGGFGGGLGGPARPAPASDRKPLPPFGDAAGAAGATADDVERIRRQRLLLLDPTCREQLRGLLAMGLSDDEAWTLYAQGAARDPPPAAPETDTQDDADYRATVEASKATAAAAEAAAALREALDLSRVEDESRRMALALDAVDAADADDEDDAEELRVALQLSRHLAEQQRHPPQSQSQRSDGPDGSVGSRSGGRRSPIVVDFDDFDAGGFWAAQGDYRDVDGFVVVPCDSDDDAGDGDGDGDCGGVIDVDAPLAPMTTPLAARQRSTGGVGSSSGAAAVGRSGSSSARKRQATATLAAVLVLDAVDEEPPLPLPPATPLRDGGAASDVDETPRAKRRRLCTTTAAARSLAGVTVDLTDAAVTAPSAPSVGGSSSGGGGGGGGEVIELLDDSLRDDDDARDGDGDTCDTAASPAGN
jgi:hypothetical protein